MRRLPSALAALGLLIGATACGSDDPVRDAAPTTSTDAGGSSPVDTEQSPSSAAADGDFPVTIEHKFGSITVASAPQRVVSIGYSDQDWLLALGVTPIAIRDWYGDQPYATWPWAQDELGDAKPTVLGSAELNFEEIAALRPDLIIGVSSGITKADYAKLAQIAPTLAQPGDYIDYGTPWDVTTELIGKAVGKPGEAATLIEHVKGLYDGVRAAHPEFIGATASVSFFFNDSPGAYASQDGRSRMVTDLGFTIPPKFDELAGDAFFFRVSNEDISTLDTDVVIWLVASDAEVGKLKDIALRSTMRAFTEGRELVAGSELSGAFSFGSPLSIEYALEQLVPELALAVDGDPSTAVPSAAGIGVTDPSVSSDSTVES